MSGTQSTTTTTTQEWVAYCGICHAEIDTDKAGWHNVEKTEPNEDGDIEYMNICQQCHAAKWVSLQQQGWVDPSEEEEEE